MSIEHMLLAYRLLTPLLCLVMAYLLGSIPTSYLIGKIFFKTDIRKSGSGNIGATNALRAYGAKVGVIVLAVDMLKGVAAVLITQAIMSGSYIIAMESMMISGVTMYNLTVSLAALIVILGHVFSVWLRFKGGKGVATAAGVFIALMPMQLLLALVLFIYIVWTTKYVSLGSIIAASALLATEVISQMLNHYPNIPRMVLVILIVLMIIIRHKSNISRLLTGTENKISFKKKTQG